MSRCSVKMTILRRPPAGVEHLGRVLEDACESSTHFVSVPEARTLAARRLEAARALSISRRSSSIVRAAVATSTVCLLELPRSPRRSLLVVLELVLDVGEADGVELGVGDPGLLAGA